MTSTFCQRNKSGTSKSIMSRFVHVSFCLAFWNVLFFVIIFAWVNIKSTLSIYLSTLGNLWLISTDFFFTKKQDDHPGIRHNASSGHNLWTQSRNETKMRFMKSWTCKCTTGYKEVLNQFLIFCSIVGLKFSP